MNIPHTKTPKFNTTNSVPLRYETVITEQPKERRGFGKTSPRFHPRKLDEVPGYLTRHYNFNLKVPDMLILICQVQQQIPKATEMVLFQRY